MFNNVLVTYASRISKKATCLNWVKRSHLEKGTVTDSFLHEVSSPIRITANELIVHAIFEILLEISEQFKP